MASFNVSVVSSVPINGTVVVDAPTAEAATRAALKLHREARVSWYNGGSLVGAFTGHVSNVWAEPSGGRWSVSLTAILPISKSMTIEAASQAEADAIARQDKPYLTSDDWCYQDRPFSPAYNVAPPYGWSEEVESEEEEDDYVAPTITRLVIIPNPTIESVATVLTAAVTSNGGVPTGTVTFHQTQTVDGDEIDTELGTVALNNGHAELMIPGPDAGTSICFAHYNGNAYHLNSTSASVDLVSGLPEGP